MHVNESKWTKMKIANLPFVLLTRCNIREVEVKYCTFFNFVLLRGMGCTVYVFCSCSKFLVGAAVVFGCSVAAKRSVKLCFCNKIVIIIHKFELTAGKLLKNHNFLCCRRNFTVVNYNFNLLFEAGGVVDKFELFWNALCTGLSNIPQFAIEKALHKITCHHHVAR